MNSVEDNENWLLVFKNYAHGEFIGLCGRKLFFVKERKKV
jgi:hypothetical protein